LHHSIAAYAIEIVMRRQTVVATALSESRQHTASKTPRKNTTVAPADNRQQLSSFGLSLSM
jgi:hypothetical protein